MKTHIVKKKLKNKLRSAVTSKPQNLRNQAAFSIFIIIDSVQMRISSFVRQSIFAQGRENKLFTVLK